MLYTLQIYNGVTGNFSLEKENKVFQVLRNIAQEIYRMIRKHLFAHVRSCLLVLIKRRTEKENRQVQKRMYTSSIEACIE